MVISAVAQPLYTVTDLGTLGGRTSRARAVNEDGTVVGEAETKPGNLHAFIWSPKEGMKDLGTLGGPLSRANAVNDHGIVAGEAEDAGGVLKPVRWIGGSITNLPLPASASAGAALGIHHFGEIVGTAEYGESGVALRWVKGEIEPLFTNSTVAVPRGINELGAIAGRLSETNTAGEPTGTAFILNPASDRPLRTFVPHGSAALAINRAGTAVGYAEFSVGILHAARFDANGATDLDTLNNTHSSANAINDRGEVVGMFVRGAGDEDRAFLVHDGQMYDLNDLVDSADEWTLLEATGINSRGQICGHGLKLGSERAFLLTPKAGTRSVDAAVKITAPSSRARFASGETVEIVAEAGATDGVKRVVFEASGEIIGTATNAPFSVKWKAPRAGDYDVFAIVTTQRGDVRKSARVQIRIEAKP